MEKYAVDLDKLLDDFEYNEEQAVRPSQFLRSELPAKKYQRPPFQRINIEDADFSPSKQTSSPFISYATPKSSANNEDAQQSSNTEQRDVVVAHAEEVLSVPDLLENDKSSEDHLVSLKLPDVTETEAGPCEPERRTCDLIAYNAEPICLALEAEESPIENVESTVEEPSAFLRYLSTASFSSLDIEEQACSNEDLEVSMLNEQRNSLENDSIDSAEKTLSSSNISVERNLHSEVGQNNEKDENGNEDYRIAEEKIDFKTFLYETSEKPPENKFNAYDISKEARNSASSEVTDYPAVEKLSINDYTTDTIESKSKEIRKNSVLEAIPTYNDNKAVIFNEIYPVKDCNLNRTWSVIESTPAKEVNENRRYSMTDAKESNVKIENSVVNLSCTVAETVEALSIPKDNNETDLRKGDEENKVEVANAVQFAPEEDIPDEELEKYLAELEIEEEEETLEIKSAEVLESEPKSEERPQRPKSLDLPFSESDDAMRNSSGSPGSTPCPKESLDNEINEKEAAAMQEEVASPPKEEEAPTETVNSATSPSPPESPTCALTLEERRLGKVSPFWVPDTDAVNCMNCGQKFTLIKRRHHCRGCGRVLCGPCCDMRATLEYLGNKQQRVCEPCFRTLAKVMLYEAESDSEAEASPRRRPNPNNPMEYCSTIPPPLQASPSGSQPPPSVLVPVLKREGSSKNKEPHLKKVMFSDGIRPGGDLTALDEPPTPRSQRGPYGAKRVGTPPGTVTPSPIRLLPPIDPTTQSFIINNGMPPICEIAKGCTTYQDPWPTDKLIERFRDATQPPLLFGVNRHLSVSLKIVQLDCCMKKPCWVFSTRGMSAVGQDEVLVLLQMLEEDNEPIPVEIFAQLHCIYQSADKGDVIKELGYWNVKLSNFLNSRQHGGFLFVRPTFQCVQNIDRPPQPFLVAVLIHRLELPWARLFPLRLMLRLGAEFRYYPCSLLSVRNREPVYLEIGQTIINLLADFRNYTYTLPEVQGLRIHMEAQQTSVLLPKNRYDQVVSALNNSNEPVLPFAGTFSPDADSHLVCMQSKGDEVTYHTQAINIHDKPRKVTGTSFIVFNASLKSTVGVQAKTHMVEDGVMVQISSDTMTQLRTKLRAMEDWSVNYGPNNEEVIQVLWSGEDKNFNRGVRSVIDGMPMDGIPSIRVHNGTDYMCSSRFIRWTQVFIIKCEDGTTSVKIGDPLELNRLAEAISRATCTALTKAKLLDHLATEGITTLALRATVTQEQVCYEAGGNEQKLDPTYMNQLDNELIPVLHKASATNTDSSAILELVFHILDQ